MFSLDVDGWNFRRSRFAIR